MDADRILQIFFKKDINAKKEEQKTIEEEKVSLIDQYNKTKQDDIYVNHGKIVL